MFQISNQNSRKKLADTNGFTLQFIQSEGKYDGNTVNRCRSVKKSAMQLGNPRGKHWRKNPRDGYGPQSLISLQPGKNPTQEI